MFESEYRDRMDAIRPPNMQQMPWRTVMSPSGFTHTAWNACPLPLLLLVPGMLAHPVCSIPLPIPHFWDLTGQAWLQLTLALFLHTCPLELAVCPPCRLHGSWASQPGLRVGTVIMAVQLPVKANLSSSIFFLRCLISKSLSFSNLYNRPFSSTVSLSWSRSCSISSSSTLQGKGRITGAQASVAQVCCPWLGTGWWLELACIKQEWRIKGNLNEQIFSILFSKQWSRTHAHKWKERQALNAMVY